MERLLGDLAWIAMWRSQMSNPKPIVRDLPTHAYDASFRMDHHLFDDATSAFVGHIPFHPFLLLPIVELLGSLMHISYVNIPLVMTLPDLHLFLANPKKLRSDFTCFHILAISCFTFTGWIPNLNLSLHFSNWAPWTGFRHQILSGHVTRISTGNTIVLICFNPINQLCYRVGAAKSILIHSPVVDPSNGGTGRSFLLEAPADELLGDSAPPVGGGPCRKSQWNLSGNSGVWTWKCWVYSQWNSHLIGIMISKTIGFRGLAYFQTNPAGFRDENPPWTWSRKVPKHDLSRLLALGKNRSTISASSQQDGWRRPRARVMCPWRDSNMAWRNWVSWWKPWWKPKAGSRLGGDRDPGIRGFDLEGAELKKWTDQLLSKTGAGKEVIMRRRHWFRWKSENWAQEWSFFRMVWHPKIIDRIDTAHFKIFKDPPCRFGFDPPFLEFHLQVISLADLPSGNLLHSYWKWPFIVDFPIENGDFP